jgi:hypothetical protein
MKTTILPTFSLSFTRAMTAMLLLTSACDQGGEELPVDRDGVEWPSEDKSDDEPTEAQTLAHSKEIVISNGDNEVTMLVASDDPALIQHYEDGTFELVPVFERPEMPESEEGDDAGDDAGDGEAQDPAQDFSQSVLIEEGSVSLEDGAIGYELHEVDSGFRDAIWTCSAPNTYVSAADYVRLDVTSKPCTEARISTKGLWYTERAHVTNQCPGKPPLVGGKRNSSRVKLEVCPGPSHSIMFFN